MAVPNFLLQLMYRPQLPFNIRVKPEEQLCIGIANMLRQETLSGKLRAIWCHVPNEGKRHRLVALVMKAMGMLAGTPDYFFMWENGGGLIEIKVARQGKRGPLKVELSENQEHYRAWCVEQNVNHALCTSVESVVSTLTKWGVLDA